MLDVRGLPGGVPARAAARCSWSRSRSRAGPRRCARALVAGRVRRRRARTAASALRDSLLRARRGFPRAAARDRPATPRSPTASARRFRAAGFRRRRGARARGRTVDGERELETVVGVRPGLLEPRASSSSPTATRSPRPGAAELSGTAALLELARIFRTRDADRRAGRGRARQAAADRPRPAQDARARLDLRRQRRRAPARAAWARAQDPAPVDGGARARRPRARRAGSKPWVVPWSNGGDPPPLGCGARSRRRCARRSGPIRAARGASAQWARRALPLAVTEQGEVNRAGLPAVLLAGQRRARAGDRARACRASASTESAARRCAPCSRSTRPAGAGPAARRRRSSRARPTGS